jgi:hypothetical protein
MKKMWSVFLAVILAVSLVGTSFAAPKKAKVRGTVQELDQQKQTFQLKAEKQSWKVIFNEETVFINDGEKADSSQLANDLGVLVSGVMAEDEKTITAQVIAWGPAPGKPGEPGPGDPGRGGPPLVKGIMSKLNLETLSFELKHKDPEGNEKVFQVSFTDKTRFVRDMKPSKPEEFKDGEEVIVMGPINPEEMKMQAHMVAFGKFERPGEPNPGGPPLVKGIMSKLNLETLSFELKHKDPEGNEKVFQVSFTDKTRFVRDMKPSKPEEFKDGEEVFVMGPINPEEMKMQAHMVAFGKFERPGEPNPGPGRGNPPVPVEGIKGIVTEINLEQMTLKLKLNDEITLEVKYYEWTGFIRGNRFVFPEELKTDTRVTVYGPVSREQKTAKAHYIVW